MANAFMRAFGTPEANIINRAPVTSTKEDKKPVVVEEPEDEFIRITNEYGHPEMGFFDKGHWFPVCASCRCHMMPNRGGGMACDGCQHSALMEMSHDYH
jgi:hypothetical protein